jgi:hypothetical protein
MENVSFIDFEDEFTHELKTYAIIDRGNNEFTSMPKAVYDEMIAQREASTL